MSSHVGEVFMPGDALQGLRFSEEKRILLGPGLKEENNEITATKSGILRFREPSVFWIDAHQKRYVPSKGDYVLGVVTQKIGDMFRVDIGANEPASLSYLSFEGATKRNRPDVKVGDLLYAKLLVANKDMEPELVCIDSHGRSSGMGVVRSEGFLFTASLNLVRKLLSPQCILLKNLGRRFVFETAIGMNGRVWVKAKTDIEIIAVTNSILASELMTNEQIKAMCKKLSRVMTGIEDGD